MSPTTTDPKPMPELPEFKAMIAEQCALLGALRQHLPNDISEEAVNFLVRVQEDPAGLRLLRSALAGR